MANSFSNLESPSLDWSAPNVSQQFQEFRSLCELYFGGPLADVSEERQVNYLLLWVGKEGRQIANSWTLTAAEKKLLKEYWDRFTSHVSPKSNFRLARHTLRAMTQRQGEPVDAFVRRLRSVGNECEYNDTDEQIIDAFIFGINSRSVQKTLLQKDKDLGLADAIKTARLEEATIKQVEEISAPNIPVEVHEMKRDPKRRTERQKTCPRCGRSHGKDCPAKGKTCMKCGKDNHFANVCRSKQHVHELQEVREETDSEDESLYFHTLVTDKTKEAVVKLKLNDILTACKLDTGAEGNVMSAETYRKIGKMNQLKKSSTRIVAFGGHTVQHHGACTLSVQHKNSDPVTCTFHVTDSPGPTLIGLPTCHQLGLVSFHFAVKQENNPVGAFKDVFEGVGCVQGEYQIVVEENAVPVVHPPRRVPHMVRDPLKKELDRLVKEEILSPVTQPSDWVNSFVCVSKPSGKIRLCLDPRDLNKVIKRPHYITPTLDDVLEKLNGAKYFSIVDARSGYWNIKLSESSSLMTTFNTPFGRYKWNRMPFGLICAQDVFQKLIHDTFSDIPGVTGIADDIVIVGFKEDGSDHDQNFQAVMERARKRNIKFNEEKLILKQKSIPFYGHVITDQGVKPDPQKVKAIQDMKAPTDVPTLRSFLGLANYMSRFTKELSTVTAPLRDLVKQSSEFIWDQQAEKAFEDVKESISKTTTLKYFDPKLPLTLQVDASSRGLGAALIQENQPIAFASKSLTECETRYSNIEREMLAVVFGLEKFHYYVYGRKTTINSDHKPLSAISQKNISNAPPRLQRMLIRIQGYDITINYVPGRDVPLADALSRVTPGPGEGSLEGIDIAVHAFNASPTRLEEIRSETAKDTHLCLLKDVVIKGWPQKRSECPTTLHSYWNYRDELALHDGLLLKGTRIIIPDSMRQAVLKQLHYAHQGAEKCKLRAKGSVFWPNINKDVDSMVEGCTPCQRHQKKNSKEPLMPHDVPKKPWQTVGSDLFFWNNTNYLVVVDYFSKFPIVRKLYSTTAGSVIVHMKSIFEEHGTPELIISDNGPQYASEEFKEFSQLWSFRHSTSSPHYPQSNGLAERTVQTVKNLLQKCKESNADPHLAMLCLRSTPISNDLPSPAEMLNNRGYQSNLPGVPTPETDIGRITKALQSRQDRMKSYYDHHASRQLPPLSPGDSVRVLDPRDQLWKMGSIQREVAPRSYVIAMDSGSMLRRNRRHIRAAPLHVVNRDVEVEMDDSCHEGDPAPRPNPPATVAEDPVAPRRSTRVRRPLSRLIEEQ